MDLTTPLTYVKGVGPARAAMLEAKGLITVEDLLGYVPFRYEDRSNMKTVAQLGKNSARTASSCTITLLGIIPCGLRLIRASRPCQQCCSSDACD